VIAFDGLCYTLMVVHDVGASDLAEWVRLALAEEQLTPFRLRPHGLASMSEPLIRSYSPVIHRTHDETDMLG